MGLTRLDTLASTPVVAPDVMAAHLRLACCGDGEELDAATAALVARLTRTATHAAEDRLQRTLLPCRWRLRLDAFDPVIELRMPPLTVVESVSYINTAGQQTPLAMADWYVDADSHIPRLVPALGQRWPTDVAALPGAVQVVYTAGYAAGAVPEPVQQWIMLAAGDLAEQTSRSSEKPAVPQQFADALLDTYKVVVI